MDYLGSSVALLSAATATGAGVATKPRRAIRTFQARGATTAGAGSATVVIEVSLVPVPTVDTDWLTLGTLTLTLATTPSGDGFATDAPWHWVRARVSAISGTGAAVSVWMGS